jgi:UDP-N-acetylmuramate dehydrogenase
MSGIRSQWFRDHSEKFTGQLTFDEALFRHTYYRIGGPATVLAIPKTEADLQWLAEGISKTHIPFFILGLGSNILVSDKGYAGLIIKTSRLDLDIAPVDATRIRTGASVAVSTLLRRAAQEGWAGLECLAGVPGSVGGVVTMNAGTHLGEAKDRLKAVRIYSLSRKVFTDFSGAELKFEYRRNLFLSSDAVVLNAEWEVRPEMPMKVKSAIDETLARRKATQPVDYPSCGSVFKNPKAGGLSAWQTVDKLGLRGHRVGDAQFAEKHSNFIINLGKATAADVRALIDLAKSRAQAELGIRLEEEVKFLGF